MARVLLQEEQQPGTDAGDHGAGDAMFCQYRSRVGVAGRLRFLDAYGRRFADLGSVVMCHPVKEVRRGFGLVSVNEGAGVFPVVAPLGHSCFFVEGCGPAPTLRPCPGFLLGGVV